MAAVTTAGSAPRRRSQRIPLTYVVTLVPVAAALNIVGGYIDDQILSFNTGAGWLYREPGDLPPV